MLENFRSFIIRFFDHLDKDKNDAMAFYSILMGLTFLMMASKKDANTDYFDIFYVFGIVSIIVGYAFSLEIILRKGFNIKILTGNVDFITYILLIVILIPKIITLKYSSISLILMLIIIVYSIRNIMFYWFMFTWKNQKNISEENKRFNAIAYSFGFTCFSLLVFGAADFLFHKIFILFLVYGIYYLVREKYLIQSIKSPSRDNITIKQGIFSHVWNITYMILYLLLLMFLLFYYNILTISVAQPTLYYFYSTSAQVFATLLGIIVMFSILILQKEEKEHDDRNRFLKNGLIGFTILYIIILILSFAGIAIKDTVNLNSIEKIPDKPDINMFRDLLSVSIFEFVFLMIPAALLYLYAMISDFLKWDAIYEVEGGAMRVDSDTFKTTKGADKRKVVIK